MKRTSAYLQGQSQLQWSTKQQHDDVLLVEMQRRRNALRVPERRADRQPGTATIAAGKKIEWKMTQGNFSGVHTLSLPLTPKKGAFVPSVLPGGVPAATPCTAKVVS